MVIPSQTTRNVLAAFRSRSAVCASCLLILLASLDPQVYAQAWFTSAFAAPQQGTDTQDDNDDEMLDTAALARAGQQARRHHSPTGDLPRDAVAPYPPRTPAGLSLPAAPVCAHDLRNGLGAPLLC
jgi:hypothetical protein